MAVLKTRTISRRTVEALKVEKDTVFWDPELLSVRPAFDGAVFGLFDVRDAALG